MALTVVLDLKERLHWKEINTFSHWPSFSCVRGAFLLYSSFLSITKLKNNYHVKTSSEKRWKSIWLGSCVHVGHSSSKSIFDSIFSLESLSLKTFFASILAFLTVPICVHEFEFHNLSHTIGTYYCLLFLFSFISVIILEHFLPIITESIMKKRHWADDGNLQLCTKTRRSLPRFLEICFLRLCRLSVSHTSSLPSSRLPFLFPEISSEIGACLVYLAFPDCSYGFSSGFPRPLQTCSLD